MKPRRMHTQLIRGLLAFCLAWLVVPDAPSRAATAPPEAGWHVDNHYQRTDLYLSLGTFLATSKETPPAEGCSRLSTTNGNSLYHCPRSYLFILGHRLNHLKEVQLRPFALQETDEEEPSGHPFVRRVFTRNRSVKTSGATPPIVTLQVVEVQLPAGQRLAKLPRKPKVLKTVDKLSLKLGQDNVIPLNLPLAGQTNIGILLTVDLDENAKKAQIIYLEASDQSQLWTRKEHPFVYELLADGFAPAFAHADLRIVYR